MSDETIRVRRHWNDWKTADFRLGDLEGLHWDTVSGGVGVRSPRLFLHGYVWCNAMVAGEVAHSCVHGEGPHRIKVCIVKKDNAPAVYRRLEQQAQKAP